MANELAFVLINPYTLAKSRTGGVIGRFFSRTGLEPVAARMFTPSRPLVEAYARLVLESATPEPASRRLLADYILKSYAPEADRPRRVLMLLLEGEDAIRRVRDVAGPAEMTGGATVRDTFGDYVLDEHKQVRYFEPAVLVGSTHEETVASLKLWARHAVQDGGIVQRAADVAADAQWQRTLVLIKPDNFRFPNARPGNIIDILSRSGLRMIAAKVHRMSVAQAEEFYGPVRAVLREKMKTQAAEKARRALEAEFGIKPPDAAVTILEDQMGPLLGDEQFNQIVKFMTGYYPPECTAEDRQKDGRQKCLALVYGGINAVQKIRELLGATDPSKAQQGSVRRELGHDIMINAAHASDSTANAEREIGILRLDEETIGPWVAKHYA